VNGFQTKLSEERKTTIGEEDREDFIGKQNLFWTLENEER